MNEKPDLNLRKEWNEKLNQAGLSEEFEPLKVPIVPLLSGMEILKALDPNIEKSLEEFKALPSKIQDDILEDLKNQRKSAMPPKKILDRFKILIARSQELERMTAEDSDKNYNSTRSLKEKKKTQTEEEISMEVDELILKIEKIRQEDNSFVQKQNEYKN